VFGYRCRFHGSSSTKLEKYQRLTHRKENRNRPPPLGLQKIQRLPYVVSICRRSLQKSFTQSFTPNDTHQYILRRALYLKIWRPNPKDINLFRPVGNRAFVALLIVSIALAFIASYLNQSGLSAWGLASAILISALLRWVTNRNRTAFLHKIQFL
jgi:hypothetical protein